MTCNNHKAVLSFFEYTGTMLEPWARAGYTCFAFDMQHEGERYCAYDNGGSITFVNWNAASGVNATISKVNRLLAEQGCRPCFVFGFPPCTDLAASGARHWSRKREKDPWFQERAVAWAEDVAVVGNYYDVPYMIENPVGALSTLWRKPDHRFNPNQYGGYLEQGEGPHPKWPEYIPAFDAYRKPTCLWTSRKFVMPTPKEVPPVSLSYTRKDGRITSGSPQWGKLGGKSLKTKNIRSATPRGFAKAVFLANAT